MASRIQHLLAPVDFSLPSLNAVRFAVRLARPYGSRITLLHAYRLEINEPYLALELHQSMQEQKVAEAWRQYQELLDSLPESEREGLTFEFQTVLGLPSEEIISACETLQPDLVVMGMRGQRSAGFSLLGSVTTAVLQRASAPILVTPDHVRFEGFRQIAYATHLEAEDLRIIDHMIPLASDHNARFYCFHVYTSDQPAPNDRLQTLQRAYAREVAEGLVTFTQVAADDVLGGIRKYVHENEIDLLVMLTHSRSLLGKMLHKSYATRMAKLTEVPLWVFSMSK